MTTRPILLATDGSPTADGAGAKAIELAKALGAPLVVATVWQVAYEPFAIGFGPVIPDLDQVGHDQAGAIAAQAAKPAREAGVETETVVRRGMPAQEICALADAFDAQLIVLGSHGWGLRRMVFGSVSTSVVHHARRPVLVVPPSRVDEQAERASLRDAARV